MPLIRLNRSLHPALPALWWARFLSAGCSVSALSDSVPLPGCKLFVDLFAGASAPLSAAIAALGLARLEPLDKLHGCGFDLLDDVQFPRLCALACSGIVGAAAAAPPCAPFSRARLRPGGPKPVRTPDFPTGIPDPSPAQQSELSTSALLHERARHFLSLVAAHGGLIILENPSSSILWLDPAVRSWLAVHAPYCAHVAACQYGLALPKAWAFWANFSVLATVACKCPHPPRFHPPFAGRRNADGSFATRQTACYPDALAAAIAAQIAPFLSVRSAAVAFGEWPSLLQPSFIWPQPSGRIQDGAGTCSSAFWGTPREPDVLKPLRSAWCSRLQTPGLLPGLLAHLVSPSKEPPLSKSALEPFLADLRLFYVTPHGPNSCTLIRDSRYASTFGIACLSLQETRIWTFSIFYMKVSPWASASPFRPAKCFSLRIRLRNPSCHFSIVTWHGNPRWTTPILLTAFSMPSFRKDGSARFRAAMPRSASFTSVLPSVS